MPLDPARTLHEQQQSLRGLARHLASSDAGADDLLQEAAVRALRHEQPRSLRGWLARVVMNLSREWRREEARRDRRERAVAPAEAVPSAGELAERHDIRLKLMDAVGSLDEPYRQTVLLRFFEGLPPRKIAARLGVPVKTVDSRLQRALARLRVELDDTHGGDRRSWMAALVPLFEPASVAAVTAGIVLMNAKLIGAAAAVVLLTAAWWVWGGEGDAGAVSSVPRVDAVAEPPGEHVTGSEVGAESRALAPEEAAPSAEAPIELAKSTTVDLEGRVVGIDGMPRAGVSLRIAPPAGAPDEAPVELSSDERGRFSLSVLLGSGLLSDRYHASSIDARYVTVLDAQLDVAKPTAAPPVVVCDRTAISGVVLAPDRSPIEGASVTLELPENVRAQLPFDLSSTRLQEFGQETDANGQFAFAQAPALDGMSLRVTQVGFVTEQRPLEVLPAPHVEIVLARPAEMAILEGVVLAEDGPVSGAHVALGNLPDLTGDEGRFRFEYDAANPPDRLMAVAHGRRATILERGDAPWPPQVDVVLDGEPPSIAGVVLDVDGAPIEDATVWLAEPTVFGSFEDQFWIAELVITGERGLQREATTDAEGRFRIEGLVDRTYGLKAMDPAVAWKIDAGEAVAGDQGVVIRFPAGGVHRRLTGRVIDSANEPVEDARVSVMTLMLAARDPVSKQEFYNVQTGATADSDENGEFVLENVPKDSALHVGGKGLVAEDLEVPSPTSAPFVIRVARVCEFRIERVVGASAVECELRTAEGEVVEAIRREVRSIQSLARIPLDQGRSEVLTAADTATVLVLFDEDGDELERIDVRLHPGERTIIR